MLMRRRRISVEVEYRQESVAVTQTAGMPPVAGATHCPSCGTPWHTPLQSALAAGHIEAALLQAAVQDQRLHLQQQPDGLLWVCERSLRQLAAGQAGETP